MEYVTASGPVDASCPGLTNTMTARKPQRVLPQGDKVATWGKAESLGVVGGLVPGADLPSTQYVALKGTLSQFSHR